METPRYIHMWAILNPSGYFIIDLFNPVFIIREFTTYDYQMIGHHVIAIVTFVAMIAFMNFTVVLAVSGCSS